MAMNELFLFELGVVVLFATLLASIAKILRQPLIPAYIIAGLLIGPEVFSLIKDETFIKILSELGIAFLLFATGLELDISRIKKLGPTISFVGIFQIILTVVLGYLLSLHLGFNSSIALYMGFLLSFSSTMVVIKFMSDINQIATLHGRIILGILLLQDIVAVSVLASITSNINVNFYFFLNSLLTALGFFSLALIAGKYVFPVLIKRITKDHEILFLASLTSLFVFSGFSFLLGLPISIGAFLGGIAMASFPYNIEISSKISSLKDFFSVIFFVSLGMELKFGIFTQFLREIIIFSLFVIIVKPFIIYILMSIFEHERKTSFFSGTYLSQISEFSLIIALEGVYRGIFSETFFGLIVGITLLTMSLTPYFIKYANTLFYFSDKILHKFDTVIGFGRKHYKHDLTLRTRKMRDHIILCGADLTGRHLIRRFIKGNIPFVVIDFNPEIIERYYSEGVPVIYGDITHPEILEAGGIKNAKLIISTVPSVDDNLFLIAYTKNVSKSKIICVSQTIEDALKYYSAGADYVIIPKFLTFKRISSLLDKFFTRDDSYFEKLKKDSINFLEKEIKKNESKVQYEIVCEIKDRILEEK